MCICVHIADSVDGNSTLTALFSAPPPIVHCSPPSSASAFACDLRRHKFVSYRIASLFNRPSWLSRFGEASRKRSFKIYAVGFYIYNWTSFPCRRITGVKPLTGTIHNTGNKHVPVQTSTRKLEKQLLEGTQIEDAPFSERWLRHR